MPGYFWCYPDNTEESITIYPSKKELVSKYSSGVYLGKEIEHQNQQVEEDMTMEELSIIINMYHNGKSREIDS